MNETKKCYVCDVIVDTEDCPRGSVIFLHKKGEPGQLPRPKGRGLSFQFSSY